MEVCVVLVPLPSTSINIVPRTSTEASSSTWIRKMLRLTPLLILTHGRTHSIFLCAPAVCSLIHMFKTSIFRVSGSVATFIFEIDTFKTRLNVSHCLLCVATLEHFRSFLDETSR
jgi:hypothetical protein